MHCGAVVFQVWRPRSIGFCSGCFLLQFTLVWARLWLPWLLLGNARWPDGLLLVLTTATVIASLTRQLPGQNVMLASVIIAFIAGVVQSLGALTAIPFGPYVYTDRIGQQLFYPLPWAVPLLWIVVILASRGVARLILRPWRKTRTYGFRMIGLTTTLVVLLDLGLEPFATRVNHYWLWHPTKLQLDWYGAPGINFFGWAVTTLLILAFATPSLINKKPMPQPPPDYAPLAVWLLLNLLFETGAAVHHLWPALGSDLPQQRCRGCLCPPRRALVNATGRPVAVAAFRRCQNHGKGETGGLGLLTVTRRKEKHPESSLQNRCSSVSSVVFFCRIAAQ